MALGLRATPGTPPWPRPMTCDRPPGATFMPYTPGEFDPPPCVGTAVRLSGSLTPDWMLKSKSTPMRSKNVSLSEMKRTSIVTCRSCRRRSWSRRSAICSWISWVCMTTIERFVSKGRIWPLPPWSAHAAGPPTVLVIKSMSDWKSAWPPPPVAGGPKGTGAGIPVTGPRPPRPPPWIWANAPAGTPADERAARFRASAGGSTATWSWFRSAMS